MKDLIVSKDVKMPVGYTAWRDDIEQLISVSKLRTAISVNSSVLDLYWHIGQSILQQQKKKDGVIK